jgi:hypothetical protein
MSIKNIIPSWESNLSNSLIRILSLFFFTPEIFYLKVDKLLERNGNGCRQMVYRSAR